MKLSREEIEALKASVRIEDVAARYVRPLRRVGDRLVGPCPFHEDTDPSFNVWLESQSWYCFGACHKGGDVFDFVREAEGVTFRQAYDLLGGHLAAGTLRPSRRSPTSSAAPAGPVETCAPEPELDDEECAILNAAAEIYHRTLMNNAAVRSRVEARGVSAQTMREFQVGYCSGRRLARYLHWRKLDLEKARKLGLLHGSQEHLRARITFPVRRGWRTVYLVGRATREEQKPKYLGLARPKEPLLDEGGLRVRKGVILAEGPFDLLALHEWGYHDSYELLALLGTRFKRSWLLDFERFQQYDHILLATDQDDAGEAAAEDLAGLFPGRAVRLRWPAHYADVGELARLPEGEGREIFACAVAAAM
jgi:DNA primase